MKYEKLRELLADNEAFTDFIKALPNREGELGIADGERVDDVLSPYNMIPSVYKVINPVNCGHIDIVKAILDSEGAIKRFFLLTIIPEEAREQNVNLALMHLNKQLVYFCWAVNRIIEVHGGTFLTVVHEERENALTTVPLHWKNVYIGEEPFEGTTQIRQHYPEDGENMTLNVNLVDLMRLEKTPIIEKVLEAYAEGRADIDVKQSEES